MKEELQKWIGKVVTVYLHNDDEPIEEAILSGVMDDCITLRYEENYRADAWIVNIGLVTAVNLIEKYL
jgi:hypothetical protein